MEPASRMIKHLTVFAKIYLGKGDRVIFKYVLNEIKDLVLYDINGNSIIFNYEYKLEFTNSANQSVVFPLNT